MPKLYFYILLTCFTLESMSQVCSGNFGDNIFESGDFGSGYSQILGTDPGIASGYTYTTNLPPSDGFYTIVSSLAQNQIYNEWLAIEDNSDDPTGYMMVINASYEPGLFYEQTIDGLCENTLYSFSADIINLIRSGTANRIDPNVSFLLNDEEIYSTGDVPKNERWNTYGFTFTTVPNQTRIKLSIRNNAPGGLGNDLALDNISFRPCGSTALILPEEVANICEDGTPISISATIVGTTFETTFVQWQQSFDEGLTWSNLIGEKSQQLQFSELSGGDYYYRYLLADSEAKLQNEKCRTNSNTKIISVIPKFVNVTDSLCEGLSLTLGENILSATGTYVDTLQNRIGCDSIVTLNLSIRDNNLDAMFIVSDPSCDYLTDGLIRIQSLTSKEPYSVLVNNELMDDGYDSITGLSEGNYRYNISDRYGCEFDTLISLVAPPAFQINLGPDQNLTLGQLLEISDFTSEPAARYEWTPSVIDCQPPCQSLSHLFTTTTNLLVSATSPKGCEAQDSLLVTVEEVIDLFIPNVFTPNNDGFNDYFTVYPVAPNVIERIRELRIFDRSGQEVFSKEFFEVGETGQGWDGTRKGRELPAGVYYYTANVLFINGKSHLYNGHVSLLR